MCILFIAINQHPEYPLIIAANRDEFYARPALASHFWASPEQLLAGQDVEAGGTWMGVTRNGLVGALTNIRDPERQRSHARSRGELIVNYAQGINNDTDYSEQLRKTASEYNGYNLLYGTLKPLKLAVFNNHTLLKADLRDGYYGLSNADLDRPWPKIQRGKDALMQYCENHQHLSVEALFTLLRDPTQAEDIDLPQTGVPYVWEKQLSSIFIKCENYGTRSSTLLMLDKQSNVTWQERTFSSVGEETERQHYQFSLG
ncbi:NRDE family protein [Alteromonas oceanisediminis]|uniref:NRDE family protein n=1 Tax=Alteromonas oceanisediminis TaxID=2836180 RepID=UPI001BDA1F44|nr:NRDE family protein [Alteromonas oceanisediminis]MBT0586387.1 NRDE family protein [Alteromonas oceanisediminis]